MKCVLIKLGLVATAFVVWAIFANLGWVDSPTTSPASVPVVVTRTHSTPVPAPTPTLPPLTPTREPTVTPTPETPSGLYDDQLRDLSQQMLTLVNNERRANGLIELVLDDNPTAQRHAEDARANCFSGHWGSNGMKPYMRYTLNGGVHFSAENVAGSNYCPSNTSGFRDIALAGKVAEVHYEMMVTPRHRRNILDPTYRKVSIGLSFNHPNLWVVQLFTTDHIKFTANPHIEDGKLTYAYRLTNGAQQSDYSAPRAAVFYDLPLRGLTRGQLVRTYCYGKGQHIVTISPSTDPQNGRTDGSVEDEPTTCRNPYDVDPEALPPRSYTSESRLLGESKRMSEKSLWQTVYGPSIPAPRVVPLPDGGNRVAIQMSEEMAEFGPGVYTLVIFAEVGGELSPVTEFSIFLEPNQLGTLVMFEPSGQLTHIIGPASALRTDPLSQLRQQMLALINESRRSKGLVEVVLDDNPAAQLHAEDLRANCFSGHWGSDGKKPYMRYTLNGGTNYSAENVSGSDYCPPNPSRYRRESQRDLVLKHHIGLMSSPGHYSTVLNPSYRKVGIGVSVDHPNLWVVQLFTTDHIEFSLTPRIEGGNLEFAYRLTNGAVETSEFPPSAAVFYDPQPYDLTRGQLARTGCVELGRRIAAIRPSAESGSSWISDSVAIGFSQCPDPYEVDPSAKPPESYEDARLIRAEVNRAYRGRGVFGSAAWLTSRVDPLPNGGYHVQTDLTTQIAEFGPGVYTLVIWADVNGESAPVSNFSVFVE